MGQSRPLPAALQKEVDSACKGRLSWERVWDRGEVEDFVRDTLVPWGRTEKREKDLPEILSPLLSTAAGNTGLQARWELVEPLADLPLEEFRDCLRYCFWSSGRFVEPADVARVPELRKGLGEAGYGLRADLALEFACSGKSEVEFQKLLAMNPSLPDYDARTKFSIGMEVLQALSQASPESAEFLETNLAGFKSVKSDYSRLFRSKEIMEDPAGALEVLGKIESRVPPERNPRAEDISAAMRLDAQELPRFLDLMGCGLRADSAGSVEDQFKKLGSANWSRFLELVKSGSRFPGTEYERIQRFVSKENPADKVHQRFHRLVGVVDPEKRHEALWSLKLFQSDLEEAGVSEEVLMERFRSSLASGGYERLLAERESWGVPEVDLNFEEEGWILVGDHALPTAD